MNKAHENLILKHYYVYLGFSMLVQNSFQKSVNSPQLSDEEKDLVTYYSQLSLIDRRWIMGQIVELIKQKEEKPSSF